jgi:hypothetical protein
VRLIWIGFVVGVGCGSSASPSAIDAAPQPPDAATYQMCKLENVLARAVGTQAPMNCGVLAVGADAGMIKAAHDCALAAAAAKQPFILIWDTPSADSRIAHAYSGLGTSSYAVTEYDYDGDPGGHSTEGDPHTQWSSCKTLDDLGACNDAPTSLCLSCGSAAAAGHCP